MKQPQREDNKLFTPNTKVSAWRGTLAQGCGTIQFYLLHFRIL